MLGYTYLHQLFVYSCNSCLFIFIHVIQLSFSCMFIILFSYLLSVHIVYMHELLPLHTHSLGRFLTTLNLHVQILDALFLLFRCWMIPYILRGAGVSLYLILIFSSLLSSCYFLILDISDSFVIPVLDLYDIIRGCLYVILQ